MSLFGSKAAEPKDVQVQNPPTDSISALKWSPTADLLAAASWSNEIRIYEIGQNGLNAGKASYSHNAPVLCVDWSKDGSKIISGGADNAGRVFDATTGQSSQFAAHDAAIKCIKWIDAGQGLTLRYWDMRQPSPVAQVQLPERCYTMDCVHPLLAVGMAERHIQIFDLNNPGQPFKSIQSPLRAQIRTIACFPDATGFALGTIEGRVAIQYVDDAKSAQNFSFKCHRKDLKGPQCQQVWAINAISFHPAGTFSTAGSDGAINIWDHRYRTRLKTWSDLGAPVSATDFNRTGQFLAYSLSYDWSMGYTGNTLQPPNKLMIHTCQEDEVKPRPKK
ncbi:hypothetical protein JCM1840_005704 [Sporobolomyces johnsonii]